MVTRIYDYAIGRVRLVVRDVPLGEWENAYTRQDRLYPEKGGNAWKWPVNAVPEGAGWENVQVEVEIHSTPPFHARVLWDCWPYTGPISPGDVAMLTEVLFK